MDQEKLALLPKWAQQEIGNNRREIASLKDHIAELSGEHPDSNVWVSNHLHDDTSLPRDSHVDFYLGDPPYRKFRNMISVQILRGNDRKSLRISTSGQIIVKPTGGCNVIEVTVEPH